MTTHAKYTCVDCGNEVYIKLTSIVTTLLDPRCTCNVQRAMAYIGDVTLPVLKNPATNFTSTGYVPPQTSTGPPGHNKYNTPTHNTPASIQDHYKLLTHYAIKFGGSLVQCPGCGKDAVRGNRWSAEKEKQTQALYNIPNGIHVYIHEPLSSVADPQQATIEPPLGWCIVDPYGIGQKRSQGRTEAIKQDRDMNTVLVDTSAPLPRAKYKVNPNYKFTQNPDGTCACPEPDYSQHGCQCGGT